MMPVELSPLALWGFPLVLIGGISLAWRSVMNAMKRHDEKLDCLMLHKLECMRDFASKREVEELDAQVQSIAREMSGVRAIISTTNNRF